MMRAHPRKLRQAPGRAGTGPCGFIRYELYILVAFLLVALAVTVPKLLQGDWKGAALSGLFLMGVALTVGGCFLLLAWMQANVGRPGTGWCDKAWRGLGHGLRFILLGSLGLIVATAILARHRLGPVSENAILLFFAAACGTTGAILYRRLGKTRFWQAFAKLFLALLGSLFGGLLGMLGPEPWAVDAGILVPILLFIVLAAMGRIVPPRDSGSGSKPGPD